MNSATSRLDQAFIQKQRQRLIEIRAELQRATRSGETEETGLNSQSHGEPHEYEDDAQKLAMLEVQGTLVAHDLRRLAQVERALAKIEDGTYGLSDSNGQPIPKDRLEAMPEAIDTVQNHATR
jgi:DnaK suppressor protein